MNLLDNTLKAEDVDNYNFRWAVEIDYRSDYSCDESGCNSEGICRCETISDAEVLTLPDITEVVASIFRNKKKDTALAYCLDRILRQYIKSTSDFTVDVSGGYYGQEIDGVSLHNSKLTTDFAKIKDAATITERINLILIKEYGHLLPKMQNYQYKIETVSLKDIKIANQNYLQRVDSEKVSLYESEVKKMTYPICICERDSSGALVLLDGYHRYTACKNINKNEVEIFVGE